MNNNIGESKDELLASIKRDKEKLDRDMREFQAHLSNLEKMSSLGLIAAGIAHEINNPVNVVYTGSGPLRSNVNNLLELLNKYAEITPNCDLKVKLEEIEALKQEIDLEYTIKETQQLMDSIQEGAKRTALIVKDLKSNLRIDETTVEETNIHACIDSTLTLLINKYKNRINIVKSYGDIPPVLCSPGKINQVLMNLLINAIQAIKDHGEIFITTKFDTDPHHISISIRDTGVGIEDHIKEKIFEPFFTTKAPDEGTGLGLPITIRIIQEHKGTINVNSKVGEGSEFIITLPIGKS